MTELDSNKKTQDDILGRIERFESVQSLQDGVKFVFRSNAALITVFWFIVKNIFFAKEVAGGIIDYFTVWAYFGMLSIITILISICVYNICQSFLYRNIVHAWLLYFACYCLVIIIILNFLESLFTSFDLYYKPLLSFTVILGINTFWFIILFFRDIRKNDIGNCNLFNYDLLNLLHDDFIQKSDEIKKFINKSNLFVSICFTSIVIFAFISLLVDYLDYITIPVLKSLLL